MTLLTLFANKQVQYLYPVSLQRLIMAIKAGINRCGCMGHPPCGRIVVPPLL